MPSRRHLRQRQPQACECIPRPCGCEKGIEFGWHWREPTQACLSGTPAEGTSKLTVYREAQRASYLDLTAAVYDLLGMKRLVFSAGGSGGGPGVLVQPDTPGHSSGLAAIRQLQLPRCAVRHRLSHGCSVVPQLRLATRGVAFRVGCQTSRA
jgi:hypothetical protein